MIKHVVLFRFREDAPRARIDAIMAEYEGFADLHPAMRGFDIGWNVSARDDRFEAGFVVEFDTEADLAAYLGSAAHEEHVVERFRPLVAERAIVSFAFETGTHAVLPRRRSPREGA